MVPHPLIFASLHLASSHCQIRRLLVSSFTVFKDWASMNLWDGLFCVECTFNVMRILTHNTRVNFLDQIHIWFVNKWSLWCLLLTFYVSKVSFVFYQRSKRAKRTDLIIDLVLEDPVMWGKNRDRCEVKMRSEMGNKKVKPEKKKS